MLCNNLKIKSKKTKTHNVLLPSCSKKLSVDSVSRCMQQDDEQLDIDPWGRPAQSQHGLEEKGKDSPKFLDLLMDTVSESEQRDEQFDRSNWTGLLQAQNDLEEKDKDSPESLDSLNSGRSSSLYQEAEEECAFAFLEDPDDDSLAKQLEEFLQVLPSMDRKSKPLLDEFDHLLEEIDELLAYDPSSGEGSLCGETQHLQVE